MATLFGYGTLSIPEIVACLTGEVLPTVPGTARGYASFRMKGRAYPGIIADPRGFTEGVLYEDLPPAVLELFNAYEDDLYETTLVPVATSTRIVQAIAYVIPKERRKLLSNDPWDPQQFMERNGKRYLRMCRKFRACFIRDYPNLAHSRAPRAKLRDHRIPDSGFRT